MTLILFWSAAAMVAYAYVLFPALVVLRGVLFRRGFVSRDTEPTVSIVVVAHNEARGIRHKLDNLLSLDYPRDRLEILVASDGSVDGTDEIVSSYADRGIRLLSFPRRGKIPALNDAVDLATGEILVFSDANSLYAEDAVRALVRPFADPSIGGVAGDQRYLPSTGENDTGERAYWNFDRMLKQSLSRAGSVTSATGAIYAIRRSLFVPAPSSVTDDFAVSTAVVLQGYRLVFSPQSVAYEPAATSTKFEFQRKVRIITRGLRGVVVRRPLLNPLRYGFYALQLFSHKVARRLVVLPLLVILVTTVLLWPQGGFYQWSAAALGAFLLCAALGALFARTRMGRCKLFALPCYFCMVNAASLQALFNLVGGRRIELWDTQRGVSTTEQPIRAAACAHEREVAS